MIVSLEKPPLDDIVLMHHGVKGMKWGIRRTPEQLGYTKNRLTSSVVRDMIRNGKISTTINPESQNKHIPGSINYDQNRSRLFGTLVDAQELVNNLSGTGKPVMPKGEWHGKERVNADHIIGVYVNPKTGKETRTNKGMIVYSKTGSHIYPRKHEGRD